MHKIYKPSLKGIYINSLLALVLIVPIIIFAYFVINNAEADSIYKIIVSLVATLGTLYITYISIQFNYEKVIITDQAIVYKGLFKEKTFLTNEIKGYRIVSYNTDVYSDRYPGKTIRISDFYDGIEEIREWLYSNYQDLDEVELDRNIETYNDEVQEILDDEDYGENQDVIEENYDATHKRLKVFKYVSWGIGLWYLFYPAPYKLLTVVVMTIPFIALAIVYFKKGMVRLFASEDSAYLSVGSLIQFLISVLAIRGLLDVELISYQKVWLYTTFISICLVYLVYWVAKKEFKSDKTDERILGLGIVSLFAFVYVFFFIVHINVNFDNGGYRIYNTQVIKKEIVGSDEDEYNLTVKPWLPGSNHNELRIWETLYEGIQPKDSVTIYLKQGVFNIPWVRYIEKKK